MLGSVIFYTWGAPLFVPTILGSIAIDFILVKFMDSQEGKKRRMMLTLLIVLNVGLLVYYKYSNFLVENLNAIAALGNGHGIKWSNVILPIGVSFFTFHKLSYVIDVYRRVNQPLKNIADYSLYILLFPQLIAGPIVRFKEISAQLKNREKLSNIDNQLLGLIRFVIGLSKKVLIANVLGAQVDFLFSAGLSELSTANVWFAIIAYSFQIYFDFSGYSDMAIGMARMMGFVFPENFNNPYISRNITEFWRRWHITLGTWMRDYLYIPLGGNKVSEKKMYRNLVIVFLISGLWHGASWNFIAWGAFHGLFLIADRLFLIRFTERIGTIASIALTYSITLIGWVLFRTETMKDAFVFFKKMFSYTPSQHFIYYIDQKTYTILLVAILFSFMGMFKRIEQNGTRLLGSVLNLRSTIVAITFCFVLLLTCIGSITTSGFNPFIYFRF